MGSRAPEPWRTLKGRPLGGKVRTAARRTSAASPCQNLYRFIRICLGDEVSDREVARRWGMEWKSFVALKHGKRRLPRLDQLETLATAVLHVDPAFVFQVGRGVPAEEVAAFVAREHQVCAVLERVNDAIFAADLDGRLQDVNPRLCQILGRPPGQLIGRLLRELGPPEAASSLAAALGAVARDGEVRGVQIPLLAADGSERILDLSATCIRDALGVPIGVQAIARDVTEERRLFRDLEAQRRMLQTIYDCVPAAYILFGRDGTIVSANARVDRVCPASADDMIGRAATDVFGDPGPAGCPVTRAFLTGDIEQQVSWVENRAGQRRYVHRIAGPVIAQGRVDQVIEMLIDVTDHIESGDLRMLTLWREQSDAEAARAPNERRAAPRANTTFSAQYAIGNRRDTGTVDNLAAGGLFLEAPLQAAVGEEIDLDWTLPDDALPVRARGIVAWTRPRPDTDGPAGVGIRFVSVHPEFAAVTRGK